MIDRTPQNQDKFVLRLPDGMRDRIKSAAAKSGRSMNAEIVSALEGYFPEPKRPQDVLSDIAQILSFVEPTLREQAIELLLKSAGAGQISKLAEAYAYSERDANNRFPWEGD